MNHSDAARKFVEIVIKTTSVGGILILLIMLQETISNSLIEPGTVYCPHVFNVNIFMILFVLGLGQKIYAFKFTKDETK